MAEANKAEAHELFGDGNIMHAADRYAKAMGHCQKVMGDMSPEQETRAARPQGDTLSQPRAVLLQVGAFPEKCRALQRGAPVQSGSHTCDSTSWTCA